MILPVGKKRAYIYLIIAVRGLNTQNIITYNSVLFDVADSDDEAFGRATRASLVIYPQSGGWNNRFCRVEVISHIESVSPLDIDALKAEAAERGR